MRKDVFEKVKQFSESDAANCLNDYQSHFLDSIMSDFRRSGFLFFFFFFFSLRPTKIFEFLKVLAGI